MDITRTQANDKVRNPSLLHMTMLTNIPYRTETSSPDEFAIEREYSKCAVKLPADSVSCYLQDGFRVILHSGLKTKQRQGM